MTNHDKTSIAPSKWLLPTNKPGVSSMAVAYRSISEYCQQKRGVNLLIAPDNLSAGQLLEELRFSASR